MSTNAASQQVQESSEPTKSEADVPKRIERMIPDYHASVGCAVFYVLLHLLAWRYTDLLAFRVAHSFAVYGALIFTAILGIRAFGFVMGSLIAVTILVCTLVSFWEASGVIFLVVNGGATSDLRKHGYSFGFFGQVRKKTPSTIA